MLQIEKTGLIIIDIQGKLARMVHDSEAVLKQTEKLIRAAGILSIPIIYTEQYPKGLGETVPELKILLPESVPIEKNSFNAMENSVFEERIRRLGRSQWLVCGIEAHICVYQTTLGMLANNFEVEVVADAVSSRFPKSTELALDKLKFKGASLTNVDMCLYELMRGSYHNKFREILPIIKS